MNHMNELSINEGNMSDVIRLYDSIIEEFPVGERKTLGVFKSLFETGDYRLLIVSDTNGLELGYAFLYTIKGLRLLWLDFIVIYPEFQSKGHGSLFFEKISSFYDGYDGMLLEVEIPLESNEIQIRRIAFYEHAGAKRLNLKYYLPNEFGGLEMYLFYKPFDKEKALESATVIKAIESAYEFIHSDILCKERLLEHTIKSQDGNL